VTLDAVQRGLAALRRRVERLLAPVAATCIFLMMALTFVEVVWRYFLGSPITGGEEIKSFLLGFTIFTALPLVTLRQRHIAVRSLAAMLRGRAAMVQRALVLIGAVAGFACIGLLLLDQALAMSEEGTLTNYLDLPEAPAVYLLAALAGVAALMALDRLVVFLGDGGDEPAPHAPERIGVE
jgi:TRAP-type C4-dicarboxylate transport system permease small subunit